MKRALWLPALLTLVCTLAFGQARPQLDAVEAERHQVADYLAQGPAPWQPEAPQDSARWKADLVVARDGSGTHTTVQAAIDALPAVEASQQRRYIHVKPGTYREIVCARGKAPFTLYGDARDPAAVVIVEGRYNGLPKRAGIDPANPCEPVLSASTYGTSGSASVAIFSDDTRLAYLTIANDAMDRLPSEARTSSGTQAVALMTQGDRILLDQVRLLGHQDTFHARRGPTGSAARVLVRDSLIAGDVDFVFGAATLVLDRCTLQSRAGRVRGGYVLAPSTPAATRLGFLVTHSRFEAEPGLAAGAVALGRAWDQGVQPGTWQAGTSPNGQALVRDSVVGAHIGAWAASTSRRPFSATGAQANRFAEYANTTSPASDIAREALASNDGWAASNGGTRGGADALPGDVTDVRNRAELVAALTPSHPRPRIVRIHGRIEMNVDDVNQALGVDDYRDPAFDFEAFARAFDLGTWGKRRPEGPLEDARVRSARRQAERIVLRVPSRTTLIGVGTDAGIAGGMLLLDRVDNVIIRNLHLSDAFDHFPAWDPFDNAAGEWNSEYDNVSLRGATHVWVDHCSFDDGAHPDSAGRMLLGRRMQHHDGLLDITRQSDFVTVSWNHFRHHDKTSLVGGGDGHTDDAGHLRVSYHHNLWEDVKERAPRVRYGQVHLYNNLHVVTDAAAYGYSIGAGLASRIVSENNVWETPPEIASTRLARAYKGTTLSDRGSLHNGRPVTLLPALSNDVGWRPATGAPIDAAADVARLVRAGAGQGRVGSPHRSQ